MPLLLHIYVVLLLTGSYTKFIPDSHIPPKNLVCSANATKHTSSELLNFSSVDRQKLTKKNEL